MKTDQTCSHDIQLADLDLYALFIRLLEKPMSGKDALVVDERLPAILTEVADYLGLPSYPAVLPPGSPQDAQSAYLSLFEVGFPAPPCPLNESPYNRSEPPTKLIRENLLFYRAFGLDLSPENLELPDHISNQLEFLSYLTRLAEQSANPDAIESIRAGKRDFIERHVLFWVPKARQKLAELDDMLYEPIFGLLVECLRVDLDTHRLSGDREMRSR